MMTTLAIPIRTHDIDNADDDHDEGGAAQRQLLAHLLRIAVAAVEARRTGALEAPAAGVVGAEAAVQAGVQRVALIQVGAVLPVIGHLKAQRTSEAFVIASSPRKRERRKTERKEEP